MSKTSFNRPVASARRTDLLSDALADRNAALLDAIITTAAVVALADGRVIPAERIDLLSYLKQQGLLALATRADILDRLEARIEELRSADVRSVLQDDLGSLAGTSVARLVLQAGDRVARADLNVCANEEAAMTSIAAALGRRAVAMPEAAR